MRAERPALRGPTFIKCLSRLYRQLTVCTRGKETSPDSGSPVETRGPRFPAAFCAAEIKPEYLANVSHKSKRRNMFGVRSEAM